MVSQGMSQPQDQPPEPPQPLRTAVLLMWVGAGLYVLSGLLFPTQLDFFRESLEAQGFSDTGLDDDVLLAPLVGAVIVGVVISAGLWILMAVMNRRGKAWARITATVLAGINLLSALFYLPAYLVDTGAAVAPPAVTIAPSVLAMVLAVVVVYLLWRPASTQYYDEVSRRSAPVPQAPPVGQALPAGEVAPPRPSGTSGLAIASLILGILGLFLVTAVLAIIFGVIALRETRRSGQGGRGLAIAGISIAAVWLAIIAFGVVEGLVEG
jgi:hypothetical protein